MKMNWQIGAGAVLLGFAGIAHAGGNVNATIGARFLDSADWAPIDQQPMIGVIADFQIAQLPLHAVVGIQVSANQDDDGSVEVTAAIADFSAGLKLMPTTGVFRPYLGAGIASVGASIELEGAVNDDDSDQSFGYYLNAGALFRVGSHFNLGLDLRWIAGTKGQMLSADGDADSFVAGVVVGYGWGT
jgi:opacity protein-like surface antigen